MVYNAQNNKMVSKSQLPPFNPNWINKGIDAECVEYCDSLAKILSGKDSDKKAVSSSFLRNIFGEIRRIESKGFESSKPDFYMLRPKVAYTVARTKARSDSGDPSLFMDVYNQMANLVKTARDFKNMVNMIEAIIAYHKVYNPK
jgi:CRISPR-associated protein Csm2